MLGAKHPPKGCTPKGDRRPCCLPCSQRLPQRDRGPRQGACDDRRKRSLSDPGIACISWRATKCASLAKHASLSVTPFDGPLLSAWRTARDWLRTCAACKLRAGVGRGKRRTCRRAELPTTAAMAVLRQRCGSPLRCRERSLSRAARSLSFRTVRASFRQGVRGRAGVMYGW